MTLCPHREVSRGHGHESQVVPDEHDHVTLDLDGLLKPPRHYYLYDPKDRKKPETIRCWHWRLSASREGIHILLCLTRELTSMEKFLFRFWNHDDIWRLSYDIIRYDDSQWEGGTEKGKEYATGVLFDYKNGKEALPWQ